jgi:hypothetical protein
MDLSVVEQLFGHHEAALRIQDTALERQRLYRTITSNGPPHLRILALAAPLDVGGNTPIEFLIAEPDIELMTLYVVPGYPVGPLPEHDVAIVIMSDGEGSAASLRQLGGVTASWPRPLLNDPAQIMQTDRDRLFNAIQSVPGTCVPANARLSREQLAEIAAGRASMPDGFDYPQVVRPVDSHAGRGLDLLHARADIAAYLSGQQDAAYFIMPFVDYSGDDGQFRKYRVTFIGGIPYACHMAISEQWKIWYLNAEMANSRAKLAEEQDFLENFDTGFGLRHGAALLEIASRLALDYFSIDCTETRDGRLLVFEAGISMVVHAMDSVDVYPYKLPQMRKIFAAFLAMLDRRAFPPQATP